MLSSTGPLSAFERLVPDVLREITIWTISATDLGPPTDLLSILLLSKHVHAILMGPSPNCLIESRQLFLLKFDNAAPVRRFGAFRSGAEYMDELCRRFTVLKNIRHAQAHTPRSSEELERDLSVALMMMLEDDGRNAQHLIHWAHLPKLLERLVAQQQGFSNNRRTALDSVLVWLLWLTGKYDLLGTFY